MVVSVYFLLLFLCAVLVLLCCVVVFFSLSVEYKYKVPELCCCCCMMLLLFSLVIDFRDLCMHDDEAFIIMIMMMDVSITGFAYTFETRLGSNYNGVFR